MPKTAKPTETQVPAKFVARGSPEWLACEAAVGQTIYAHSTVDGKIGRWFRIDGNGRAIPERREPQPARHSTAEMMEPPAEIPAAESARVAKGLKNLAEEIKYHDKPKPNPEAERAAAQAKLLQMLNHSEPLPKLSEDALRIMAKP